MLALSHGQLWNASEIGRSLGLSYHTVNSYLEYLQGAYLVRLLPPWHGSLRKRLVKSPRVYWRDSGLLHALLGVRAWDDLLVQPWVGSSWKGWAVEQVLSHLASRGVEFEAHSFRTSDGLEADLVLDLRRRWVIEVKLSSQARLADLDRLEAVARLVRADVRCLVNRAPRSIGSGDRLVTDVPGLVSALDKG
jgi:hypothetical protein